MQTENTKFQRASYRAAISFFIQSLGDIALQMVRKKEMNAPSDSTGEPSLGSEWQLTHSRSECRRQVSVEGSVTNVTTLSWLPIPEVPGPSQNKGTSLMLLTLVLMLW